MGSSVPATAGTSARWVSWAFWTCCYVSTLLTLFLTTVYWKQRKNPLIILCGLVLLLQYVTLFSGLLYCRGNLLDMPQMLCFVQGLILNYCFVSTNIVMSLILTENCLMLWKSKAGRLLQYTPTRQYRLLFIYSAIFIPIIPSLIVLCTESVAEVYSAIQPRYFYCFFVRCSNSETIIWILAYTCIALVCGLSILAKIWEVRAKACKIAPMSQERGKAREKASWIVAKLGMLKRIICDPRWKQLKSNGVFLSFLLIFGLYFLYTLMWLIPTMQHARFIGKESLPPMEPDLMNPSNTVFSQVIDELMSSRVWYIRLSDDIVMKGGSNTIITGLGRFFRILQKYLPGDPSCFDIELVMHSGNQSVTHDFDWKATGSTMEGFIMGLILDYRRGKISLKRTLCHQIRSRYNQSDLPDFNNYDQKNEIKMKALEEFSDYVLRSPIHAISIRIINQHPEYKITRNTYEFNTVHFTKYFSIFFCHEVRRCSLQIFLPAFYGIVFFLMFGLTRKCLIYYGELWRAWRKCGLE